jgi:hypothetical protein
MTSKLPENAKRRVPDWRVTLPLAQATPRCGARTRTGMPCRAPAMACGKCRMHGGASTGPRTSKGLERIREARTTHGRRTAEMDRMRAMVRVLMAGAKRLVEISMSSPTLPVPFSRAVAGAVGCHLQNLAQILLPISQIASAKKGVLTLPLRRTQPQVATCLRRWVNLCCISIAPKNTIPMYSRPMPRSLWLCLCHVTSCRRSSCATAEVRAA